MSNVVVTGLLCISMLLVASSCNPCLFIVEFYWNIKKGNNTVGKHKILIIIACDSLQFQIQLIIVCNEDWKKFLVDAHLSGIISPGHLISCNSAATQWDRIGAFPREVQTEGKQAHTK